MDDWMFLLHYLHPHIAQRTSSTQAERKHRRQGLTLLDRLESRHWEEAVVTWKQQFKQCNTNNMLNKTVTTRLINKNTQCRTGSTIETHWQTHQTPSSLRAAGHTGSLAIHERQSQTGLSLVLANNKSKQTYQFVSQHHVCTHHHHFVLITVLWLEVMCLLLLISPRARCRKLLILLPW